MDSVALRDRYRAALRARREQIRRIGAEGRGFDMALGVEGSRLVLGLRVSGQLRALALWTPGDPDAFTVVGELYLLGVESIADAIARGDRAVRLFRSPASWHRARSVLGPHPGIVLLSRRVDHLVRLDELLELIPEDNSFGLETSKALAFAERRRAAA